MPYTILIDPEQRASFFSFYGTMTADEGRAAFREYLEHPKYDPSFVMLTDARQISRIDASYADIMHKVMGLSHEMKNLPKCSKSYILTSQEHQTGMARMLQTVLDMFSPIQVILVFNTQDLTEQTGCALPQHWEDS